MKLRIILTCLTLLIAGCEKDDLSHSLAKDLSTDSLLVPEIIPERETPEKRRLWEADRARNELNRSSLRSISLGSDDPMFSLENALFSANVIVMNGEKYRISPASSGNLYLSSLGVGKLAGFSTKNYQDRSFDFFLRPVPSTMGFSHLIESPDIKGAYLGAGKYKKQDVAYVWVPDKNLWGTGWNIIPQGGGKYLIQSSHAFEYREDDPSGIPIINRLVLGRTSQGSRTPFSANLCRLVKASPDNYMLLEALSQYDVKGIRFFRDLNQVHNELYSKEAFRGVSHGIVSCEDAAQFNSKPVVMSKVRTFASTRTYRNDASYDVEYDMYFDDRIGVYSDFNERSGIKFSWHRSDFPIPYIEKDSVKSSGMGEWVIPYKRHLSYQKTLQGMLPLLISPKTEVKVSYTYEVYRVTLPYIVYLESRTVTREDGKTPILAKIVGLWTGDIVAQDLVGRHKYERKGTDSPGDDIDFGDIDDEITFDVMGLRSTAQSSRKRIRL